MLRITLASARVNARLTQREAAKALKISTKTLVNWENGKSYPNAEKIDGLCSLYGVSVDNIIFLQPNNA